MFRNSHSSTGSSMYARNRTPRWRYAFIALMLSLAIGSAGQTTQAQAAQPRDKLLSNIWYRYSISTDRAPAFICVGTQVDFRVVVVEETIDADKYQKPEDAPYDEGPLKRVKGIAVNSSVDNPKIGKLSPPRQVIGFGSDFVVFKFTANQPGYTELIFNTDPNVLEGNLTQRVQVKVQYCKYKVKTLLKFPAGIYDINVISEGVAMKSDEQGNFTGSGSMYWVYSNYASLGCKLSLSASDSRVDLTGKLDGDGGQFGVTETFQPTKVSLIGTCPLASASKQAQGSVDPLILNVASTGGVSTQTVTAQGISGTAHIVVVPEDSGAAAFIPGNQKARLGPPSPWWAMPWDHFSSLFGVLRDLR